MIPIATQVTDQEGIGPTELWSRVNALLDSFLAPPVAGRPLYTADLSREFVNRRSADSTVILCKFTHTNFEDQTRTDVRYDFDERHSPTAVLRLVMTDQLAWQRGNSPVFEVDLHALRDTLQQHGDNEVARELLLRIDYLVVVLRLKAAESLR